MSEASTKNSNDRFIERLREQKEKLRQCQESHSLSSCLSCPSVLGCPTRQSYVKAVYESMSKGEGGDFEF
ncbi:hypothetical protein [Wolinella succinogenes]|uniref:hypothetical protein n=1 Tax=Wolinella succinogenes TaxID=844 RepID=UPI00240A70F9|nr:hypothetical protein [Wolinella succinogenes]